MPTRHLNVWLHGIHFARLSEPRSFRLRMDFTTEALDAFGEGQPTGTVTVFGPLHTVERARPLKRGYPALVPGLAVLTRPKNPLNALFNLRNVAC